MLSAMCVPIGVGDCLPRFFESAFSLKTKFCKRLHTELQIIALSKNLNS